jgi:short-subunit dehydrogenase
VGIYAVDIQKHSEVDFAVERAIAELGEIEVLINNVSGTSNPSNDI